MRLVIVGGGPAALSAAKGYRAAGGDGDVTMLTRELVPPYHRPPLSKAYLRGEIDEPELQLEPPGWYAANGVELRLNTTVTAVRDEIELDSGETLPFDACILATGARPKRLFDGPQTLRSLADARVLRETTGRATVIGSGFIGCEAAASLAMNGLDVTLVTDEDVPHEARLGEQAGHRIAGWLTGLGVTLRTGTKAESGTLMAVGVESERIPVDAGMRTSRENVYAAGDLVRAHNASAGRSLAVEHWGEALNMGEIAGRNAAGEDRVWDVAPGFWSEIGPHTIKYAAWGDGYDESRLEEDSSGFTVWYGTNGITVGVLTHNRDADYERGKQLVEQGAPLP